MNLSLHQLQNILTKKKIISKKKFEEIKTEAKKNKKKIEDILVEKKIISQENLLKICAEFLKVPFVDLSRKLIRKDILFRIPEPLAKKNNVVAFDENEKEIKIAMTDPTDLQTIETIKKRTEKKIKVYLTSEESINKVLVQYQKGLRAEFNEIVKQSIIALKKSKKDLKKIAEELPIVRIVDTLLRHAILQGASDIHIEPLEKQLIVRYRIDGILQDVIVMPKEIMPGIVARIKILANLKIDEHRLPQDGRFKVEEEDYKISIRVSILPVFTGEKVVMRLLSEKSQKFTLEQLGLQHSALKIVKQNIKKPHGMILATGPTGCGKTTTLYAILNILNTPKVNISTIEDPIEYQIPRINQSQVKPKIGYTFATGLRALVRQDPDIIMVGEIRDLETAEMAIHAALTGHLLLSTLHTNSAAGAPTRLIDMGIKPFLIASTLNCVIAQRLVRRICPNCIESYKPSKDFLKTLEENFNTSEILEVLKKEKIIEEKTELEDLKFYRGRGCEYCNQQGYKGRIGIFEVMENNEAINKLILKEASSETIQEKAQELGMITMHQDGFIKAITGITTIEEVLRVTRE